MINALTDQYHPCQLLADMQTWIECRGEIRGRTAAFVGDGHNMCNSWINAARQFDFTLHIATPGDFAPTPELLSRNPDRVHLTHDPFEAVQDADVVVTDVWASMGQEAERQSRMQAFNGFQINEALMAKALPGALFMHCLPAHRGEEVTAEVIDGPQSVVWREAENRLHAQKALLEKLLA